MAGIFLDGGWREARPQHTVYWGGFRWPDYQITGHTCCAFQSLAVSREKPLRVHIRRYQGCRWELFFRLIRSANNSSHRLLMILLVPHFRGIKNRCQGWRWVVCSWPFICFVVPIVASGRLGRGRSRYRRDAFIIGIAHSPASLSAGKVGCCCR